MINLHRRGVGARGALLHQTKPLSPITTGSTNIGCHGKKKTNLSKRKNFVLITYLSLLILVFWWFLSFLFHLREIPQAGALRRPSGAHPFATLIKPPLFARDDENGRIFFFKSETEAYYVESCNPCKNEYNVCAEPSTDPQYIVPLLSTKQLPFVVNTEFLRFSFLNKFVCKMYPMGIDGTQVNDKGTDSMTQYRNSGYSFWKRRPIKIEVLSSEPKRINIVMTGLGRDLTGGPLSIMRFASAMLDNQLKVLGKEDFGFRWINVDGSGIDGDELAELLEKYDSLSSFRNKVPFIFDALNPNTGVIRVNPDDLFMATLYWTSFVCHETTKHPQLHNKNFLYFIQDFEPIFFPQDTDYLEAMESYRLPHFAIYSTEFLYNWFRQMKYGQYHFLPHGVADAIAYASEPAIKPWGHFDTAVFDDPTRTRKLIVYARSHADRNAYELTIDTLSRAVCEGLIEAPQWEVIGVGALEDDMEYLGTQCGKRMKMKIWENIPEPEYRQIVRSGDVGLSLMVSPHPSLPPLDFASAGLVTVTNVFETKTRESFERISKLFVVSEPYPMDLLIALEEAIKLSEDIIFRKTESEQMNWESEWDGERCYGTGLLTIVQRWFRVQQRLWDTSQIANSAIY